MKDIRKLIDDIWDEVSPDFPFFREKKVAAGNAQHIDDDKFSRCSRISRAETSFSQPNIRDVENTTDEKYNLGRASRDIAKTAGNPGTPGNASKDNTLFFPLERERTGNPGKTPSAGGYPADACSNQVADAAIDIDIEERAAIMEIDGGLDRAEAERLAAVDQAGGGVSTSADTRDQRRLDRLRGAGLPAAWIDGALTLSPHVPPCPGFRAEQWPRTYDHLVDFLTGPLAIEAAALDWPIEQLFGVHATVGVANVSVLGACLLADRKPIIAVERDAIRFERQTFRRREPRHPCVLVWRFCA